MFVSNIKMFILLHLFLHFLCYVKLRISFSLLSRTSCLTTLAILRSRFSAVSFAHVVLFLYPIFWTLSFITQVSIGQ